MIKFMKPSFRNLYKNKAQFLVLFLSIIGLINCSGSAKRTASPFFLENVAKIEGKFSVYISDKKLENNPIIESEDCESWQIQIELDKAYREFFRKSL